jgi:hypothetical protein
LSYVEHVMPAVVDMFIYVYIYVMQYNVDI